MSFTVKKIRKSDIYEQKWPNNLQFDRKPHSNLVALIEKDLKFEELKKIENSFEQEDELFRHIKCSQNLFDFEVFKIIFSKSK